MASGIWLSNNEYIDFFAAPSGQELLGELATRAGAIVNEWMGLLPDPDPVLRKSGDGFAALEALAADYKVMSCMQTRKLTTLGRSAYDFSPGCLKGDKPTPGAVALCNALKRDLERVDLYNLMSEVLDAPYFGLTVAEQLFRRDGIALRLTNIVPKPVEWFAFDTQNRLRFIGADGLAQWEEDAPGILPPYGRFVMARHFPTYRNPYGLRLLSRCLFPVAFKRGGIEFMMRFAERWGMPWIVGTARPSAPPSELSDMRNALAGMVQDAVSVVNSGAKVELVQANGQAGDLHLSIIRHWDDAIAQVIAGQTLTSTVGESGSYAASKTHGEILDHYSAADATLVKIFFDEVAWIYATINAHGALSPVFEFEEAEDQAARADLGTKLHEQGVRFTPAYFERRFGLAPDEFRVVEPGAPGGDGQAFTASDAPKTKHYSPGQQAVEELVAELLPQGVTAVNDMAARILMLVDKAQTPEELQELLAGALTPADRGGLDAAAFSRVLECALFAADMTGRFAARENTA